MSVSPLSAHPVTSPEEDERFMAEALKVGQSGLGRTWPNPSVGAVVVQHVNGRPHIVGAAATAPTGRPHAEPIALAQAGEAAPGSTLYVTLEPCPMCAAAISLARIRRLYWGADDPKGGGVEHGPRTFSQPTCHHRPEVYGGIGEREASALLKEFFRERR